MELLTAAQMRMIETEAIESGAVSGLDLMERAGQGVLDAVLAEWPDLAQGDRRAVVLCGPGNNGGDGFVVASLLHERGWEVQVYLYGDPERLPPDARENHARWRRLGSVSPLEDGAFNAPDRDHPDIYVDALFGTGLRRPLKGLTNLTRRLEDARTRPDRHVVCIDVPSGLCADSGRYLGRSGDTLCDSVIMGDLTVTFHRPKIGLRLAEGAVGCGRIALVDIGLAASETQAARVTCPGPPLWRDLDKHAAGHKYDHGHALVVCGGPGKTGAARMAARGALRIGAGLVTLACPLRALPEVAAQVTGVMLAGLDGPSGLAEILEDARLSALCLGPGLGLGQVTAELVRAALEAGRPCVLDADALSRFQRTPESLFTMLHGDCVLTPHGGEFARLFPDIADRLQAPAETGPAYSKLDAAREAAEMAGCVVLFKGADTVIAAPDGKCSIISATGDRAAPWLATAGAGDVLSGFITGLLARGVPAMRAAEMAAWLQVDCARSFGPGLIAEDLPEELPRVFSALACGE